MRGLCHDATLLVNINTIRKCTILDGVSTKTALYYFFCIILQKQFYFSDNGAAILMFTADFDVKEYEIFVPRCFEFTAI